MKNNLAEKITFTIFFVLTIIISFFHEPWYDELQAWAIAKENILDILFVIPHQEGHPPLWHLILKFCQIFTNNVELALKIPNLTIMFTAIWLLIFKSPFPRIIRLLLPFTFFLLYQYTVICRPYSLFVLTIFAIATLNKSKNEHPFIYTSVLAILALSSLYGAITATGLTFIWLIEIWNKQNFKIFIKDFLKDKRFYAMLSLFFVCLYIAIVCFPETYSQANSTLYLISWWEKILYIIGGIPGDATMFNIITYSNLGAPTLMSPSFIICCLEGIVLLLFISFIAKKNNCLNVLCLTYIPLTSFLALYVWPHHIGLITVILIYVFWEIHNKHKFSDIYYPKIFKSIVILFFATQLYWSCYSCITEITYDYAPGKKFSEYIKKYNFTKYKIAIEWNFNTIKDNEEKTYTIINNSYHSMFNPYFDRNIFINANNTTQNENFYYHPVALNEEEFTKLKNKWIQNGKPELLILSKYPNFKPIWGNYFPIITPLYTLKCGQIWKNEKSEMYMGLYVNTDQIKPQYNKK